MDQKKIGIGSVKQLVYNEQFFIFRFLHTTKYKSQ